MSGHITWGRSPNCRNQSLSFPGSRVLMFSRLLVMSCLICCTWSLSLRLALYHLPRLLTGCSETVGIGLSPKQNFMFLSFPLAIEMPRDLLSSIFSSGSTWFSCSFPSSRLVHAAVVVRVVRVVVSSMYAWIGGRWILFLVHSPPTTHFEVLMMTSMAIVKARGEIVQPAMMPTSRRCHDVVKSAVVKHSCRSSK